MSVGTFIIVTGGLPFLLLPPVLYFGIGGSDYLVDDLYRKGLSDAELILGTLGLFFYIMAGLALCHSGATKTPGMPPGR